MREKLIAQLENYQPYNEQEAKDKDVILALLKNVKNIFDRENQIAHMCASAWVLNETKDKVLMCYHNIYDSYSWLGGHADGNEDLLAVAVKEVQEESGLQSVFPYSDEIFSIEVLTVDGHQKRGQYVSSHLHINLTYLLIADEQQQLRINQPENSDVQWFAINQAVAASSEKWFRERVYSKLNEKLVKKGIIDKEIAL